MKRIGIVGMGYIGNAVKRFFCNHYEALCYDPNNIDSCTKAAINSCEVAFITVPTPSRENGRCDTRIVEEVVDWIDTPLIVIKSTVEPGTTDRLTAKTGKRIVYCPEFISESTYYNPFFAKELEEAPFYLFGGDKRDTREVIDYYLPIGGPTKKYVSAPAVDVELMKYVDNSFFAVKTAFFYEMAKIAEKLGTDWKEVRELLLLDPRIGPLHTAVFKDNETPFGGKCLPKDLLGLYAKGLELGVISRTVMGAIRANH